MSNKRKDKIKSVIMNNINSIRENNIIGSIVNSIIGVNDNKESM